MTDRDRFTLHILPSCPLFRHRILRCINVLGRRVCFVDPRPRPTFPFVAVTVVNGVDTVYWNAETYGWQTTPPKRKKPRKK